MSVDVMVMSSAHEVSCSDAASCSSSDVYNVKECGLEEDSFKLSLC